MPVKPLYAVYVFLIPESARRLNVDLYGGERATSPDEALSLFMRYYALSYVQTALILRISETGEVLGGEFRLCVSCEVKKQEATK
jgi:glucan phosphoethanolaminetransferase (alkaline phosphatase superfamily)